MCSNHKTGRAEGNVFRRGIRLEVKRLRGFGRLLVATLLIMVALSFPSILRVPVVPRVSGDEDLTVDFTVVTASNPYGNAYYSYDKATVSGGMPPYSFNWDFGENDPTDGTGDVVRHYYQKAGAYPTKLTLVDSSGKTAFAEHLVQVQTDNGDERCDDIDSLYSVYGWTWAPVYLDDLTPRIAEGNVTYTTIATEDHPANHASQDFNLNVQLDTEPDIQVGPNGFDSKYEYLVSGLVPYGVVENLEPHQLHMELETKYFHPFAWPAVGDRVWAAGEWIWDCGHELKTELHPLVGIATTRNVPVEIQPGSPVKVDGKRADIWFTGYGGLA